MSDTNSEPSKVPCPACGATGKRWLRVNYGAKGCKQELRACLFCGGTREVTALEAAQFNRDYRKL